MVRINEDLNQYKEAYKKDFKYNDENLAMLQCYASSIIDNVTDLENPHILSLGIGHKTVSSTIIDKINQCGGRYVIIEGSQSIIDDYIEKHKPPTCVDIIHSYFEEYETIESFDLIEMGFVLEHVDNPENILSHYCKMLKKNGLLFIAVPNATSLHRQIGHKAGLLKNMYQLSPYDLELGHKRYFDIQSISKLVETTSLKINSVEGILLKPLTTEQMNQLKFSKSIFQALFDIGKAYPELCNAILIKATIK